MTNTIQNNSNTIWRNAFWAISIVLLVLMPMLSVQHGQSGDEWSLIIYGNDIYNYFFHHNPKALNYDGISLQFDGLHYYGGLYDFTVTFLHKTFFSFVQELTFRHIVNAIIGALLFIYTGLIAKHIAGWRAAVLAIIFIALSPRLFGESMNNPKDIPFAFANVFFIYYTLQFLSHFPAKKWKYAILMGVGFGFAMGFRIGGILMIPYAIVFIGVSYFFNKAFKERITAASKSALPQLAACLGITVVVGYVIGIMFWPWALQEPLSRPLEALNEMTNRQIFLRVLFEGQYIMNNETPWYYTTKWIFISNPVYVLVSFLTALALIMPLIKRYSFIPVFVIGFTIFFPVLYAIYKHSTVYDTWRHFFFVYPSIAILGALANDHLLYVFAQKKAILFSLAAVIVIGMSLPLMFTVRNSPNEYCYFNELEGGAAAAYGQYDFDYYQNSGKQAAVWISKNAAHIPGRKVFVGSNMSGFDKYFVIDSNWIASDYVRYTERGAKNWDYFVTYSRFISVAQLENKTWPPANAVHIIKVDGVPISAVLHRKNNMCVDAYAALNRKQFDSAIRLYQQYVQTEPNDETVYSPYAMALASVGQFNQAIAVLNQAIKLDPSDAGSYDMMSKIYNAMGDRDNAQKAMNMAQQLSQQ